MAILSILTLARVLGGNVFALLQHPYRNHVYSPVPATTFSDLPIKTPLVYLLFLRIELVDSITPIVREPLRLVRALRSPQKFIAVLCPIPYRGCQSTFRSPLRYIVPSERLRILSTGHTHIKLGLSDGELIDKYATEAYGTAEALRDIFRWGPEQREMNVGHRGGASVYAINLDHYVVNKSSILQAYMDQLDGKVTSDIVAEPDRCGGCVSTGYRCTREAGSDRCDWCQIRHRKCQPATQEDHRLRKERRRKGK